MLQEIFEWLCLTWQFASISSGARSFLEHSLDISQGSVAT